MRRADQGSYCQNSTLAECWMAELRRLSTVTNWAMPLKTRDRNWIESREVKLISGKDSNSEPAKEFHYVGVISPPFLDSASASWIAGGERLRFGG